MLLSFQFLCWPAIVLIHGGSETVVANECPQHIVPEPLMLIAIAVVDLEGFEIFSEDALGTGQETGACLLPHVAIIKAAKANNTFFISRKCLIFVANLVI